MDAHSNPARRTLKSVQEQEDRRRRRNERDRAWRAAETAEQRSEILSKRRERNCAKCAAQTASERQVTSQQRSTRERERMAAKTPENDNSVPFKAKMSCKHGYIGYANMLYLFRKISWLYSCKAEIASMQTAWCWESPVPIKRIEMFYLPTYTTSVASWGEPERAVECDMGG